MNSSSDKLTLENILIPAAKFLGWVGLGGATTFFLFFWCIIGLGEVFGGTEVGNG